MSIVVKATFPNGSSIIHVADNRFELSSLFGLPPYITRSKFIADVENKFSKEGLKLSFLSADELKNTLLKRQDGTLKRIFL